MGSYIGLCNFNNRNNYYAQKEGVSAPLSLTGVHFN